MRRVVKLCVALIIALLSAVTILLHTHWALARALDRIEHASGNTLTVGTSNGTLTGPVTLRDVTLKSTDFTLHVEQVTLDWSLTALLTGSLDIRHLTLKQAIVTLHPKGQASGWSVLPTAPPHLPLRLNLHEVVIAGLSIRSSQLAGPLQATHVQFTAQLDNQRWQISRLSTRGGNFTTRGELLWQFTNRQHLDATLDASLALTGQPQYRGRFKLVGAAQQWQLHGRLTSPFALRVDAVLQQPHTQPHWQGRLEFGALPVQALNPELPAALLDGKAVFSGTPAATDLHGQLHAQEAHSGTWDGQFRLRWQDARLQVQQLDLARTHHRTRFALEGAINFSGTTPAPDLHGTWRALVLPFNGKPWLHSPHGKLHVLSQAHHVVVQLAGTLTQGGRFQAQGRVDLENTSHPWELSATAQRFHIAVASRRLPTFNGSLQASGDTHAARIKHLTLDGLGGQLALHGRYEPGTRRWQAVVTAHQLDPAAVYPDWPGALDFAATLKGHDKDWSLQLRSLSGRIRKAPVSVSGQARYQSGQLYFSKVNVTLADNRAQVNGHLGRRTRIVWQISAPQLDAVWPQLEGTLASHGSVELDGNTPHARFNVHANRLRYHSDHIDMLDAAVNMDNTAQNGLATLSAAGIRIDGHVIDRLETRISGSLAAHSLAVSLSSPFGNAQISGQGSLANDVWQGSLEEVALQPVGAGRWQAETAWQPRIGVGGLSLPTACVVQAQAQVCLDLASHAGHWHANARLKAVPLHDLAAVLPAGLEYSGHVGGSLQAGNPNGQPELDLHATLSPGSIHNLVRHRRVTLLDYTRGTAHLHVGAGISTGTLQWRLRDGGFLDVDTRIAHGTHPGLSGRIQGELHDFGLIPALIPDVSDFEGRFRINLSLSGTPDDPEFQGSASLEQGAINVPRLGLNLDKVRLTLQGSGRALTVDGEADSGTGTLHWHSDAHKQDGIWHAQGKIAGQNFRIVNIPEARADISPELDFTLDGNDVVLNGKVVLPYARIEPRNLSSTAQVSPDQVIVGDNEAAERDRWHIHSNVQALMGEDVRFNGFGLTGRITGGVRLTDEPGHYTIGNGELQIVDGKYSAYGQKLDIKRGRLMFNGGPASNPALDIRALRQPAHPETVVPGSSEQQVGVIVRGSLKQPSVSLFSNPPLPQSALLSYLLTGQLPATPSQSPLIGSPATGTGDALKYSGGEFLAQQLGDQIGLSDVSIQNVATANGNSTPSLFIGKYLSPRLYVSYGTGLLQSLNTIRIRYTLSTKWMLEAESGAASSADIIYTLEH